MKNPSGGGSNRSIRTDGRTDTTKLIVDFGSFTKAIKKIDDFDLTCTYLL